ncbi:MAG TPA: hypothetical protein VK778_11545 [Solirubrobacteraceae bacterium]|jgi:hypothetical protein|nr:hypothetical protein [Solirubrobacteraceae bacterium]
MKSGGGGHLTLVNLLWLIPLAIAAVYLIVFVLQLPRNITELAWDGDYASGFTLPETLARTGTGGYVVLGAAAEWVPLWFGLLTARLPLHRELWEITPTLLFVATALIVGWCVATVADRRAAILAVLIGLVASPLALVFLIAPVAHNTVYPCTALLGAYLIWLARGEGRRLLTALAIPPILGVVIGACLASDLLLAATAVIPLALTAALAGLRRDRRSRLVSLSALTTLVVAIPIAKLIPPIMHAQGYLQVSTPTKAVSLSELPERAQLLFNGLKALFNGYLGGPQGPGTLHAPLGVASDIVMCAALLTLIVIGMSATVKFVASGLRKSTATRAPAELARSLHVIYWVGSAAVACGSFWIAAETGGGRDLHEAYYGTVIFSVAAVVPLVLSTASPVRWLLPAGAAIFFAASLVGLMSNYMNIAAWLARDAPSIVRTAEANHVTFGYGGYGEASGLTWNTHGRVTVRPLMECENPQGANVCAFYLVAVPSWYVPEPRHTFLLVDREEPWVNTLPRGLGRPLATYAFGPMRMYIYSYDIASRVGPPPGE